MDIYSISSNTFAILVFTIVILFVGGLFYGLRFWVSVRLSTVCNLY